MHIVHLEDDAPLRDILNVALSMADPATNMQQFISSNDALEYIEKHTQEIDLFVLDIRVPGRLDGLGVARRIRELKCPGTVLLTSAFQKPSREVLAELNCEWLAKPWYILEVPQKLFELSKRRYMKQTN